MSRLVSRAVCATAILSATTGYVAPLTTGVEPEVFLLVAVPEGIAASAPRHGPFRQDGDRTFGVNHDEVGAVAAPQIEASSGSGAGAMATLRTPCRGNWRFRVTVPRPIQYGDSTRYSLPAGTP